VAEARVGEDSAAVRRKLEEADLTIPLLVDDRRRPAGWLSHRALDGERVEEKLRSPAEPVVELDDILRDALSDLLSNETRYAPVVDSEGRAAGVLSLEVIGRFLHTAPVEARTGADLVEDEGPAAMAEPARER
jgi:osmoprotectant transport system ATP-binding protein